MTMDPTPPAAPVPGPHSASNPVAPVAPVAPVVAVPPRAKSGGILNLLLVGAAIIAIGGVAFAIGRATAPANAFQRATGLSDGGPIVRPDGSFGPVAGGPAGFALDGEIALDGTVKAIDADSLTLTLTNGEEMTFTLDAATTYREATDAAAADVAVGDEVSVKVAGGGRVQQGGNGGEAPDLKAGDVTVAR